MVESVLPGEHNGETPDDSGAFPRLNAEQIDLLARYGERRPVRAADVPWPGAIRASCSSCPFRPDESGTAE